MSKGLFAAIVMATAIASCNGSSSSTPLCGTGKAAADCSAAAGTWSGTWDVTQGQYAGLVSGDWRMTIATGGCRISGTASIGGVPGNLSGIMCDGSSAEILLDADGASGSASVVFGSTAMTGQFSVTMTKSMNGSAKGTFTGKMDGTKQ
jgi:hypothetical protein